MCNLGQGIYENGVNEGVAKGIDETKKTIVMNMFENNMTVETIAKLVELDVETVNKIVSESEKKN